MRAKHATKKSFGVVPMVYEHAYSNYLMNKGLLTVLIVGNSGTSTYSL